MYRLGSLLFLLAVLFLNGCGHEAHEAAEPPKLPVTRPLRKTTELHHEYVAQVRSIQHIELRALERGYLQGIYVDEGQRVKRGQRMFQLMPLIYQAEVMKARAEAGRAEIELNNTRMLAEKDVVSPNELALARANFNKANAEVALAAAHRGLTEIRAPFDGIMGLFQARKGSLIDEGDLLTTLSDNSRMWVYFNVAEAEYLQTRQAAPSQAAQPVSLVMANGQLFDQPGMVETIEADFNNETGTIAFRATFPNPRGLLRHGETGKVRMAVPLPNALLIPQKATFDILDRKFVFVIDDQHVVHSRPITVAAEMTNLYAIESGLDEKDTLLLDGLRKVRDGSTIEPEFLPPEGVLANLDVPAE